MKKNIWHDVTGHPEMKVGQYVVPNFVSNALSIQCAPDEFVLYSPGHRLVNDWIANVVPAEHVANLKIHIIMPNHWHYMGVSAWLERFPDAVLYASKKAQPTLQYKVEKSHPGKVVIHTLDKISPLLPPGYEYLVPPGHRAGDVWLKKTDEQGGVSWILCDSFLNYERMSRHFIARMMQRLFDAAPGLKISTVQKYWIFDDREAFRDWVLAQLAQDKPTMMIPSHGEIARSDDLFMALEDLVKARL
jgi:hypothetical protein